MVEGSSLTLQGAVSVGAQRTAEGRSVSAATLAAGSSYTASLKLFGLFPVKDVAVKVVDATSVVPCGTPFGIKMFTDGVLVVGMSAVDTPTGSYNPAKSSGIKVGDVIVSINGETVSSTEQVAQRVEESGGKSLDLSKSAGTIFSSTCSSSPPNLSMKTAGKPACGCGTAPPASEP